MREALQLLAIPLLAVAMALRGAERRVMRRLRKAEATSPETAVELPRVPRLGRWQLARLEKAGALVRTEGDRGYFVEEGYAGFRRKRRKRALVILVLLAILAAGYFADAHLPGLLADDRARAAARGEDPGGMIMIHGQRNGFGWLGNLAQRWNWTDGCVAVSNVAMEEIWRAVPNGTPITIEP